MGHKRRRRGEGDVGPCSTCGKYFYCVYSFNKPEVKGGCGGIISTVVGSFCDKKPQQQLTCTTMSRCPKCNHPFSSDQALGRHLERSKKCADVPYDRSGERVQCSICKKWISSKSNLKSHRRNMHDEETNKRKELINKLWVSHVWQ